MGSAFKKAVRASKPPAEAPMPTTGNAAPEGSAGSDLEARFLVATAYFRAGADLAISSGRAPGSAARRDTFFVGNIGRVSNCWPVYTGCERGTSVDGTRNE